MTIINNFYFYNEGTIKHLLSTEKHCLVFICVFGPVETIGIEYLYHTLVCGPLLEPPTSHGLETMDALKLHFSGLLKMPLRKTHL